MWTLGIATADCMLGAGLVGKVGFAIVNVHVQQVEHDAETARQIG